MAFDQKTRNLLQRTVSACRNLLDAEFAAQRRSIFGINDDGTAAPLETLSHLPDEDMQTARLLRDRLDHIVSGLVSQGKKEAEARKEAVGRVTREQAFTVLNRLAALRMAEEREIVLECVRQGMASEGFELFQQTAGGALGNSFQTYRAYLFLLFDELAIDLGVLFSRWDPAGLLFPRQEALEAVLHELNGTGTAATREDITPEAFNAIWAEDETIGWIYQYYNDQAERKKMREESAAPRNSRELAVRNQFFTPRYVVEFLTDNTLGRIWYEMTRGDTALKEQCRYLVRRPNEIFLAEGETPPAENHEPGTKNEELSQEALLKQPVHIPHRPLKDPRTILMLDPACGSMHFGLYAFDLFEVIYREAWNTPELQQRLAESYGHGAPEDLIAVPESVQLCPGATVKCFASGRELPASEAVVVLSRYNSGDIAGRPLIYHPDEVAARQEGISITIPLAEFNYARAIRENWFAPSTGYLFLGLAECFNFERRTALTLDEAFVEFGRDIPRLIIEHNIHGIDIDPRAAQIAGLSLWLRAQKAWQRLGLKPAERPAIKRSNIVCAEPMPGEKELLREFVEREFPAAERPVCLRLLEAIFDKMQLAGEAGSLLKIEEEIRSAIEDARDAWQKLATRPPELFTTTELNQLSTAPELTGLEQAVSSLTTDPRPLTTDFWERIEERIYAALRDYAEQAENGGGFQRRLFAEDAARGFAFIDVCRKRYDVAVMNPPFGLPASESKRFITDAYPDNWKDIYAAFGERAIHLLVLDGLLGAITPNMWLYTREMRQFRHALLSRGSPMVLAELGLGVMDDAMVEAALWVGRKQAVNAPMLSLDLLDKPQEDRPQLLLTPAAEWRMNVATQFMRLEGSPYCHHLPAPLLAMWETPGRMEPELVRIAAGNTTFDDFRFLRVGWEVSPGDSDWRVYRSGGDYQPYFSPSFLRIEWKNEGAAVRQNGIQKHGSDAQVMQSSVYWGKAGLAYPRIGTLGVGVRIAPHGEIFSSGSVFLSCPDVATASVLVGVLNSSPVSALLTAHGRHRRTETLAFKDLPIGQSLISASSRSVAELAGKAVAVVQRWERKDETSPCFLWLDLHDGWLAYAKDCMQVSASVLSTTIDISSQLKSAMGLDELGLPQPEAAGWKTNMHPREVGARVLSWSIGVAFGRWDIRYATGEQAAPELPDPFAPLPVCPPGQLQNAQGLPARPEDVPAAYPIRISWDGILVDDPNHPLDIERRVREVIEIIWSGQEGGPTAEAIEHEACEILGVKSLRDYFRKPAGFFADHLKRYSKSRRQAPIYWPLSTASGSYTLWIYYHRLTPDTLYKCLELVQKKMENEVEPAIHRLRTMLTADEAGTKERKQLADAETLLNELKEMHAELSLWAPKWKPNLNDGVLITASPLWKLFRLPKWRAAIEACWKELDKGDYDWAHLALTLWPARVREKCKTDRSLAIAHGLEELCEVKPPEPKKKRATKKAAKKAARTDLFGPEKSPGSGT